MYHTAVVPLASIFNQKAQYHPIPTSLKIPTRCIKRAAAFVENLACRDYTCTSLPTRSNIRRETLDYVFASFRSHTFSSRYLIRATAQKEKTRNAFKTNNNRIIGIIIRNSTNSCMYSCAIFSNHRRTNYTMIARETSSLQGPTPTAGMAENGDADNYLDLCWRYI